MANTLLTPQVITNELLRRFKNNLGFAGAVRHEYDDRFANSGGKIGDTLNVRVPVKFGASDGAALVTQDVTESSVPLVIDTQKHVGFSFTSKDRTLTIDRFGDRYLNSAAVALANQFDVDGLTMAYQATYNSIGTPGTVPGTFKLYTQAGALLDKNSCPMDADRSLIMNADMQVEILDATKGLFQSSSQIKRQYEKGRMGTAAGFDWIQDQNVRTHTVGALGGTPLVNGAAQTGASLITDGWTAAAAPRGKKGDTFTVAGCFAVNPVSGDTLSHLQQITLTADVSSDGSGNATLPISPSLIATGASKTVSALPADNAAITWIGAANVLTPQGIAFHKEAFAVAMVPMDLPEGVHSAARSTDKETGMSIRIVSQYNIETDKFVTRADIMYGWKALIPQWACRIQS